MTICAVVVTFNRPDYLKKCIAALNSQTLVLDEIIIIDNASKIPAAEVLGTSEGNISHFRMKYNTGGAGGFYVGIREAFKRGHDAVWIMDDDGMPEVTALEFLVSGAKANDLGIAGCIVTSEKDHSILAFPIPINGKDITSLEQAKQISGSDGIINDYVAAFNGILVNRITYEKIGNVKFECFIWGDEVEFKSRAKAASVRLGTVTSSIHHHPEDRGEIVRVKPFSPVRLCPPERSRFHYRNVGYIYRKFMPWDAFLKNAISYVVTLILFGRVADVFNFLIYYLDGATNLYCLSPSRSTLQRHLIEFE